MGRLQMAGLDAMINLYKQRFDIQIEVATANEILDTGRS
jgi:hypothetical protein